MALLPQGVGKFPNALARPAQGRLRIAALPVTIVERTAYASAIPEATRRIGHRDPDDVEILALALHLGVPVWSNDNDFEDSGVERHTPAEHLKMLGIEST